MDTRKVHPTKAIGVYLAIASLLGLAGVGCAFCILCGHGAGGTEPEDLAAIVAVLNRTTGPLTVIVSDPAVTDVLQADEAIFYALRQSTTAREFEFQSGELTANASLRLVSGGDTPVFATGLMTVRFDEVDETLVVPAPRQHQAFHGLPRSVLGPGSSVFLLINATSGTLGVGGAGRGSLLYPDEHTAIALDEGDPYAVMIEAVDHANSPELLHVFEAPTGQGDEVSAFLVFVILQDDELALETQRARFRRLE